MLFPCRHRCNDTKKILVDLLRSCSETLLLFILFKSLSKYVITTGGYIGEGLRVPLGFPHAEFFSFLYCKVIAWGNV